jgi:hypothetical protein
MWIAVEHDNFRGGGRLDNFADQTGWTEAILAMVEK